MVVVYIRTRVKAHKGKNAQKRGEKNPPIMKNALTINRIFASIVRTKFDCFIKNAIKKIGCIFGAIARPNLTFDSNAAHASIELEKYIFMLIKLSREKIQAILG